MSLVGCSLSLPARVRRARSGARVPLAVRHPGAGVTFQANPLLTGWSWDPFVLGILALSGALYALGWYRLGHRSRSRGGLRRWRTWCFSSGLVALGVALLSPIDTFDGELFALHMAQHLLLLLVVP